MTATPKTKLTKAQVDKAEPSLLGDIWLWDADLEGFGLRIRPSGHKTYVIRYRTKEGVQRKQTVARPSDMTPEKARELARREFAKVAEGQDPMTGRAPAGPAKTVGAMFTAYVASLHSKGRVSASEVERALLLAKDNAADALGRAKPAGSVESPAVVDYLSKFFLAGHRGAADKHRGYIASAYTWAMKSANDYTTEHRQDWGVSRNPATDVPRDAGASGTRDRNLSIDELRCIWGATSAHGAGFSAETAACIRLLICCGQRVQETLRMDGGEIDLKAKLWRMPAHKTKGGKLPHTIPLPEQILPALRELVAQHGDGPLFPARTGSSGSQIDHRSVMRALERWCLKSGVPAFQTRDLRRTWKSRTHDAGIDRFTRDLIQQHSMSDTGSKNYDRANYLPEMRQAMDRWASWLTVNVTGPVLLKAA